MSYAAADFSDHARAAARMARLCGAAFALSDAGTEEEVARAVVTHGVDALGASAGAVARLAAVGGGPGGEAPELELLAARGYPADLVGAARRLPLDAPLPLAACVREGEAIWLGDVGELERAYPHLAPLRADTGSQAFAAVPLRVGREVVGALGLSFPTPQPFPAEDRAFVLALAHHAALALDRARRCDQEEARGRQLEAAMEARDRFISVAAHELNTPMTSLLGFAQLLERDLSLPSPPHPGLLRRSAQAVLEQAERLARLVAQLLDLARVTSGSEVLAPARVDLGALLRQTVSRPSYARLGVEVHAPLQLDANVDGERLRRSVELLLDNVRDHCPRGTPVVVSARRISDAPPAVEVAVRDSGPGVPWAERPRIFEPFFRGAAAGAGTSGLGVGLFLCRALAELHGGKVFAEFPPEGGTSMVLRLPG